jgi:hypothetical protein
MLLKLIYSTDILKKVIEAGHVWLIHDLRERPADFSFFSPLGLALLIMSMWGAGQLLALPVAQSCEVAKVVDLEFEVCGGYFVILAILAFTLAVSTGALRLIAGKGFGTIRFADHLAALFVADAILIGLGNRLGVYPALIVEGLGSVSKWFIWWSMNAIFVFLLLARRANVSTSVGRREAVSQSVVIVIYLVVPVAMMGVFERFG